MTADTSSPPAATLRIVKTDDGWVWEAWRSGFSTPVANAESTEAKAWERGLDYLKACVP